MSSGLQRHFRYSLHSGNKYVKSQRNLLYKLMDAWIHSSVGIFKLCGAKSSLVDRQERRAQRKRGGEPLWHGQSVSCDMLEPCWRHITNTNIEFIDINTLTCSPCPCGWFNVFKFSVGFLLLDSFIDFAGITLPLHDHFHRCLTSMIGRLAVLSNWWLTPVAMRCATSPLKL